MSVRPLFESYPNLEGALPHLELGTFPTPIERLERFGKDLGAGGLHMKRDDLSGEVYGGNKVRKLEFLLAEARRRGAKEVMTFGCVGSNHATATAVYAQRLGMRSISILLPQPNAHSVRRNLLLSFRSGAELHFCPNAAAAVAGASYQLLRHKLRTGQFPYIIPAGGSSPLGVVGFVDAALELKRQIDAGQAPAPDLIYAAAGTCGTVAGLMLGLKAAGLESRVVCVRVTPEPFASTARILKMLRRTNTLLRKRDPSFPLCEFAREDIILRHDFFGGQYGLYTDEAMEAVRRLQESEGIKLEGTYTGKALAALTADLEKEDVRGKVVLFWNTYNSRDFSEAIAGLDYHELPQGLHRWFEEDVQPLDRADHPLV